MHRPLDPKKGEAPAASTAGASIETPQSQNRGFNMAKSSTTAPTAQPPSAADCANLLRQVHQFCQRVQRSDNLLSEVVGVTLAHFCKEPTAANAEYVANRLSLVVAPPVDVSRAEAAFARLPAKEAATGRRYLATHMECGDSRIAVDAIHELIARAETTAPNVYKFPRGGRHGCQV